MDLSQHPRNPYKGLRPFQREDAADFFGREQCIDALAHALRETLLIAQLAPRFLAVIGPRGSGKTSVVMAGTASTTATRAAPTEPRVDLSQADGSRSASPGSPGFCALRGTSLGEA